MATSEELSIIGDIILRVFDSDPVVFEASLEAIKLNTDRVTIDNQIAELRKQQQAFSDNIEAQIQALLGLK